MNFVIRVLVNGLALWLAALLLPGISIPEGQELGESLLIIAVIALIFTLVNAIVKPIVSLLALPLTILTLGLFHLVINALMLLLTGWLTGFTDFGLEVDGFWWAVLGGLVIALISAVVNAAVPARDRR